MVTLSFKVSEQEARAIRSGARREGVSVSEYLRRRAAASAPAIAKPRIERCPVTGAPVFDPVGVLPPLTVQTTREMLADFP